MQDQPRKILLTGRSGQFAGVERRILQEALVLRDMGHDVTIAHTSFPGDHRLIDQAKSLDIKVFRLDLPPFLHAWRFRHLHYLRYVMQVRHWRFVQSFDLVHVFMAWSNAGLEHTHLASHFGLSFVVSAHNAFPKAATTPWHRRFLASAFEYCAGVYGVSNSALELFEAGFSTYLPHRTVRRAIHNYVDTRVFVPNPDARSRFRRALNVPEDVLLVGCLGRLSEHKRPLYTLEVFSRVAVKHRNAHFVFVGEGALADELRTQIRQLSFKDRVHVLPFTSTPEDIFPALDVHVLLSKVEGFGISTVEALSCGVPVVATAVPGSEEILKHEETGFLVGKDDAKAAVDRICDLLNDSALREQLGHAGRRDCERRFSREVWEKQLAAFYRTILNEASATGRG